ncbi:MAG: hypothetical protein AB7W37_17905, partial [Syntrophobacteraceae bacterium]
DHAHRGVSKKSPKHAKQIRRNVNLGAFIFDPSVKERDGNLSHPEKEKPCSAALSRSHNATVSNMQDCSLTP